MSEPKIVGGSESDKKQILEKHDAYLDANSRFDWEKLKAELWSGAPEATFFNLNGHTYNGRDHWVSLWKYYKEHIETGVWVPYDIGGVVGDDVATIWCHRKTMLKWVTDGDRPDDKRHEDKEFVSRSTMTFHKEDGDWRVIHVHFSEASDGERPGGI